MKQILILLLILLLIPIADASYLKKAPIQINNTGNASILTNYQVNLNISYDSDMNSDFSDLLVFNSTTSTSVPFWIQNKIDGSYANIWFNATYIPASVWNNNTYYLYYGNSSAVSLSNGNSSFRFFEDCTVLDTTTRWTDTWAAFDSVSGKCEYVSASSGWTTRQVYVTNQFTKPFAINYEVDNAALSGSMIGVATDNSGNGYAYNMVTAATTGFAFLNNNGGADLLQLTKGSGGGYALINRDTGTTKVEMTFPIGFNATIQYTYSNGTIRTYSNSTPNTALGFFLGGNTGGSVIEKIDNLFIRNYVNVPPTSILGSESSNIVSLNTSSATSITTKSAIINGNITMPYSNPSENVYFQYGAVSGIYHYTSPVQVISTSQDISYSINDTPLFPGKTYYYRLKSDTLTGVEKSFTVSSLTNLTVRDFDKNYQELEDSNFDLEATAIVIPKVYTDILASIFWGLMFSIIFIVGWIRSGEVKNMSILGMLIASSILSFVPPEFQQIGQALLVVSIAGLLISIVYKK